MTPTRRVARRLLTRRRPTVRAAGLLRDAVAVTGAALVLAPDIPCGRVELGVADAVGDLDGLAARCAGGGGQVSGAEGEIRAGDPAGGQVAARAGAGGSSRTAHGRCVRPDGEPKSPA